MLVRGTKDKSGALMWSAEAGVLVVGASTGDLAVTDRRPGYVWQGAVSEGSRLAVGSKPK